MRRPLVLLAFVAVSLVPVMVPVAAQAADHLAGEVLVILEQPDLLVAAPSGRLDTAVPALAAVLVSHGLTEGEYLVHKTGNLTARDRCFLRLRTSSPGLVAVDAARELAAVTGIAAASPNYLRELFLVPNDPYWSNQWHFHPGNPAGVRLAEAWDLEMGDPDVVVAIMDTGVDWSHPDLGANIHLNPGEIPGNGVDDDANGYIDDVRGWDFGNHDADARPHVFLELGLDVGFHGTHCAGIAAAVTDNGVGVAGAAGGCSLLPLKVVNTASQFTDAAITEAFLYAIDNGADVISMSFGGPDGAAFYQNLVDQAVAAGVVCVAAAGNNNDPSLMYPAACAGVISVGATNPSGQRASFSSYGAWVTVNAPGEHIWSTIQNNYEFDLLTGLLYMLVYEWDGLNPYMYSDGTSMACPLVAGVCGLVRSLRPGWNFEQVAQHLVDTGQSVGFDQPIGVKIDAHAAVAALVGTAVDNIPAHLAPTVSCAPNPFNPRTVVRFTVPATGMVRLDVVDLRGRRVRTLHDGALTAGRHEVVWDGCDTAGRPAADGAYLLRLVSASGTAAAKASLVR